MSKGALFFIPFWLLGCASSGQDWDARAPRDGVQYEGRTLNSPVSDEVPSSGPSLNDDGARTRVMPADQ